MEEVSELGGAREDEVGRQEGWDDVVLGVEGELADGGVLGAERHLGGDQSRFEDGEGGGFWEVMKNVLVGHHDGDHDGHRFFPTATFFGAG